MAEFDHRMNHFVGNELDMLQSTDQSHAARRNCPCIVSLAQKKVFVKTQAKSLKGRNRGEVSCLYKGAYAA